KGKDLKAMGIPPGAIYRQLLDELLDARINKQVKNRPEELRFLTSRHPELFSGLTQSAESKDFC
ncbi:MAG: hypothetical protein ACLQBD_04560, partial [Syntrophobacteraceae bacterium]